MTKPTSPILTSLACNLDRALLETSLPLFQTEQVEAIEWSFDTLFKVSEIPDWFNELLLTYASANRLIGHGVYFSLLSARWLPEQEQWLNHLKELSKQFKFDHLSEHFGFMTGANFHQGAPMSVPFNERTLKLGQDRLMRLYDACECPVGIENLAYSYSLEEVQYHGEFLDKLIEPVNGFLLLDLHNLYCQVKNFEVDSKKILENYPLEKVREIHISGGSWESSDINPQKKIRRDTHDDKVPEEVFDLLKQLIPQCPNLKFVVLEQLGSALKTPESQLQFRKDYGTLQEIVHQANNVLSSTKTNSFIPHNLPLFGQPVPEDLFLFMQQNELTEILETAENYEQAMKRLTHSSLSKSDWHIETWKPEMLETALKIARKWKVD